MDAAGQSLYWRMTAATVHGYLQSKRQVPRTIPNYGLDLLYVGRAPFGQLQGYEGDRHPSRRAPHVKRYRDTSETMHTGI